MKYLEFNKAEIDPIKNRLYLVVVNHTRFYDPKCKVYLLILTMFYICKTSFMDR